MSLPPHISSVCAVYRFDRCSSCPLSVPCLKFCAAPTRNVKELDASREVFAREASEILKGAE